MTARHSIVGLLGVFKKMVFGETFIYHHALPVLCLSNILRVCQTCKYIGGTFCSVTLVGLWMVWSILLEIFDLGYYSHRSDARAPSVNCEVVKISRNEHLISQSKSVRIFFWVKSFETVILSLVFVGSQGCSVSQTLADGATIEILPPMMTQGRMLRKSWTRPKDKTYRQKDKGQHMPCQRTVVPQKGWYPFKCQFCGHLFRLKHNWLTHERRHTGEKPFNCRYCVKAFACSSDRKLHERLHTGEKPYKCEVCGKAYSDKSNCRKHQILCSRKHATAWFGVRTTVCEKKHWWLEKSWPPLLQSIYCDYVLLLSV